MDSVVILGAVFLFGTFCFIVLLNVRTFKLSIFFSCLLLTTRVFTPKL